MRVMPDGARMPIDARRIEDIGGDGGDDLDNPPLTPERLSHLRPVPRVKTLRRALGLTQEAFAGRYRIPLGTLRDWEQGRSEPDQPARAYLIVIANDPAGVAKALHTETA